jgi:hypothetical protein
VAEAQRKQREAVGAWFGAGLLGMLVVFGLGQTALHAHDWLKKSTGRRAPWE